MKSAYELAMERLQSKDRKEGIKRKPLSGAQKEEIAEVRQQAKAKKAELQILRNGRMAEVAQDPAKLAEEEQNYQTDLRRIESQMESKITEIKNRGGAGR